MDRDPPRNRLTAAAKKPEPSAILAGSRADGSSRRRAALLTKGLSVMLISRRLVLAACLALPAFGGTAWAAKRPVRIGVFGGGPLGDALGRLWVRAGHEVRFAARHPDDLAPMVKRLGPRATVGTPRETAEFGEVVVLAVPYDTLPKLGKELQGVLDGKIVLDASNPRSGAETPLAQEAMAEGVGRTSAKYLPGARLVRAFSAVDAMSVETSARRADGKLGVPLAGDDPEALEMAAKLVRDTGCEPVVVGDLAAAVSFQRGGPGFRANTTAPNLRRLLGVPDGQ